MIDYNIISTGSMGNAVVINNTILIDCGVPFRALKGVYKRLKLVLLTHIHSDHFNRRTIKKLAQERPALRFGCCDWLAGELLNLVNPKNIDVYEVGSCFDYGKCAVTPVPLVHNAHNCGYIIRYEDNKMVYATDTNTLDHISAPNCDLYMIEANYGEDEIIGRIRRKEAEGKHIHEWDVLQNHLSREKADAWLALNAGPRSRAVYLHEHIERHPPRHIIPNREG